MVPFRPPEETAEYFRTLADAEQPLAVLVDDGEKFGGWPRTREWVYESGWLGDFLDAMRRLTDEGVMRLVTPGHAVRNVESRGLAYLPTASYREMEGWALPRHAAARLDQLEAELGEERLGAPEGALIRGGHWRNFFVKYPESNRMHKKMQRLSSLCRDRGNPPGPRHAITLAQCNDAYWHGVFGGLYLPHLRRAIWENLARAEAQLRVDEPIAVDRIDIDGDGHEELWIHSAHFSAIVSPRRGGGVEEYTVFSTGRNYVDVLTRRIEVYHRLTPPGVHADGEDGAPSIHDLEGRSTLSELPPADLDPRAIFVDRVLPADLTESDYARAAYEPVASWATTNFSPTVTVESDRVTVDLLPGIDTGLVTKQLTFGERGDVTVRYGWQPTAFPPDAWFAPEISLAEEIPQHCEPRAEIWSYPIATVAKSERGLDETVQGIAVTPRWPVQCEEGRIELRPG
jgi:alpha-amylase